MFPGFPNIMMGSGVQGFIPSEHFKAVTYTGAGGTPSITGVGFQPDFVWIKNRDQADTHVITDVLRGVGKTLTSSTNAGEVADPDTVTSFDADGFSLGADVKVNTNTEDYVAWCLKAGGAGVTNTDGSLTSTVSANVEAGFSIVKWSAATGTIGHGLSQAPELIIDRKWDTAVNWIVEYTVGDGSYDYMRLNTTAAKIDATWPAPTDTVFEAGINADEAIAYCFHSVPGFSKVGSYTGDGGTNNYVELGFRPAFVMFKRTDSVDNWIILDNVRDTANPRETRLFPNLNLADNVNPSVDVDFSDNGFTLTNTDGAINASGGTYIYLAFAA